MTRKELMSRLNQFEASHPVDEWIIDDIQIWAIIKIDVYFRLIKYEGDREKEPAKRKRSKLQEVIRVFQSFFLLICLWLKPKSKKPKVFFSGAANFWYNYQGKFENQYFQPMIDYLGKKNSDITHLYINSDPLKNKSYPKSEPIYFINKYYYFIRFLRLIRKKSVQSHLPDFNIFLNAFDDKELEIHKYKRFLTDKVAKIKVYEYVLDILFKKSKVIAVFELCYYSHARFALNRLSRFNKIPIYEIQHGGMGPEHVAYGGWNNLPKQGYDILPQYFCLWDEASYQLLNEWIPKQGYHQCILNGNPRFDYLFSRQKEGEFKFPKDKKVILYTMQDKEPEDYLLETIENTPDTFQWWIRMHPRRPDMKEPLKQRLRKKDILNKVVMDRATTYPLPFVLKQTFLHVSDTSGSTIEAAQLNVPSIITDELGVSYYAYYIKTGIAVAETSKSSKALLEKIEQHTEQPKKNQPNNLHSGYRKILDELIEQI